ncbi:MAG: cation-transporting P-type ATPase, partial [Aestuariivirgaceae bacterium]|nr:cation-transporting P-type ATPase [Aestuariivirgaceae bacterium]
MKTSIQLIHPHSQPASACLAALDANPHGLSRQEALRRLGEYGPNRLPAQKARSPLLRFAAQFNNVLIFVLLGAALVTGALQHWLDTSVIIAVVLANALIGFLQESNAEAAMAAIHQRLSPHAAVLRDGARVTIEAGELVPGDIV